MLFLPSSFSLLTAYSLLPAAYYIASTSTLTLAFHFYHLNFELYHLICEMLPSASNLMFYLNPSTIFLLLTSYCLLLTHQSHFLSLNLSLDLFLLTAALHVPFLLKKSSKSSYICPWR